MVFEVIRPNFEINRRHAATLPIPVQASSVRAASGSSVEGFGQILAALLPAGQWLPTPGASFMIAVRYYWRQTIRRG
jgi:hypothetical protein